MVAFPKKTALYWLHIFLWGGYVPQSCFGKCPNVRIMTFIIQLFQFMPFISRLKTLLTIKY